MREVLGMQRNLSAFTGCCYVEVMCFCCVDVMKEYSGKAMCGGFLYCFIPDTPRMILVKRSDQYAIQDMSSSDILYRMVKDSE
jgi:hypothetical protein